MTQEQPDTSNVMGSNNTSSGACIVRHLILRGKDLLSIDLRTLALFRIMLAITSIVQLVGFWPDIFPFFDDRGIFPRQDARDMNPFTAWSLYFISGNVVWAQLLFVLNVLSSLALLVGYRSRTAAAINWVLIGSLWTRGIIFAHGSQMQLALLSFWAMFLPLSSRFSVDAALNTYPKGNNSYFSWATLAILIQEMYMYFFGALEKMGDTWQISYNAIYFATHSNETNSPLGASLLGPLVEFERLLTIYVYHLELFAVVFLFFPLKTAWARLAILPLLISMHIGFGLFLSIGFFPVVSIAGLMVFVPGLFWDKLLPWWNRSRWGITLYYDQDCGFCRKTCQIFSELSLPPETRIIPAQQVPEIGAILQRDNSWVVEDGNGIRRTRWDAVAWVWRRSPILWPLGILFLPPFMRRVGDCLYLFIARHRSGFGKLSGWWLRESDVPLAFNLRPITQWFLACLTASIMIWNISVLYISTFPGETLGPWYNTLYEELCALKLAPQGWKFFAPDAPLVTVWVVIEGKPVRGGTVDLLHNTMTPPTHELPENGYEAFPNSYWMSFFRRTRNKWDTIGAYYCSTWKVAHPDNPIGEVTFTYYRQLTPPSLTEVVTKAQITHKSSYKCLLRGAGDSDPEVP